MDGIVGGRHALDDVVLRMVMICERERGSLAAGLSYRTHT
jgi:hypothetical protein